MLYSLPSTAPLCDKFLDGVYWPADKAALVFVFPEKEAGGGKPVRDMVSRKKYVCRLSYLAEKRAMPAGRAGPSAGLVLAPFKTPAEHRKWAAATYREYFVKPFRAYLTPAFEAEARDYYRRELPKAKGISVRKAGKVVSMLTLLKVPAAGARPLDWVTWVWADPALSKPERRAGHALLRAWLRRNCRGAVGATVHAANARSQKWFLKSGFRPARISFSRRR